MSGRLLLEVLHGPLAGQTLTVPAGSVFLVGRMPECQLALPQDPTVSRQHFRIEYRPPDCRLIHISQTSETFVNGQVAAEVSLKPGDEIAFGTGNLVRVALEPAFGRAMETSTHVVVGSDAPVDAKTLRFCRTKANSGVSVFTPAAEQFGAAKILETLGRSRPALAWIDFGKLGQPVPEDLKHSPRLFSWLPSEAAAIVSPVLITKDSTVGFAEIVANAWGKDALLCFGCNLDASAAAAYWQKAVIAGEESAPPKGLLGYYIPSVVRQVLQHQTETQVAPLMSGLSWLLTEAPDVPGQWMLFGREKVEQSLTASGWTLAEPPTTDGG